MSDRAIPPLLRRLNERTVLETIRLGAPISRAEISRRAEISKPTVSLALQSLLDAGLVRESRSAPQGPSYGAIYFESVPEAALVLGLDLGARFLRGPSATWPARSGRDRTSSYGPPTWTKR
jgi:DNA-binding transcriptional ArsR family regulator